MDFFANSGLFSPENKFILDIIYLLVMFCSILALLSFLPIFRKKKDISKIKTMPFKYDFKEDIVFLDYIIEDKISKAERFELEPLLKQKTVGLLRDDTTTEISKSILTEVLSLLSPHYKKDILLRYFKNEAEINKYISDNIYTRVLNSVLSKNFNKLSK